MRTSFAACLVAATSTLGHDFSLCMNEPDLFGTTSIDLIPDPPMPGQNFTTKTTGTPTITVTGGTSTVTVKALGITVLTTKYDLCVIRTCPIEKGVQTTSSLTTKLSGATPHGVSCKNKIVNVATDGSAISCIQQTLTIGDARRYNATEALAWAAAMNAALPASSPVPVRKCASGYWEVEGEECAVMVAVQPTNAMDVAATTHYGDPLAGACMADEQNITIQGVAGSVCSPAATGAAKATCPTDTPAGCKITPAAILQDQSGDKYCALECSPSLPIKDQKLADTICGVDNMSCKPISGVGICTYDA